MQRIIQRYWQWLAGPLCFAAGVGLLLGVPEPPQWVVYLGWFLMVGGFGGLLLEAVVGLRVVGRKAAAHGRQREHCATRAVEALIGEAERFSYGEPSCGDILAIDMTAAAILPRSHLRKYRTIPEVDSYGRDGRDPWGRPRMSKEETAAYYHAAISRRFDTLESIHRAMVRETSLKLGKRERFVRSDLGLLIGRGEQLQLMLEGTRPSDDWDKWLFTQVWYWREAVKEALGTDEAADFERVRWMKDPNMRPPSSPLDANIVHQIRRTAFGTGSPYPDLGKPLEYLSRSGQGMMPDA